MCLETWYTCPNCSQLWVHKKKCDTGVVLGGPEERYDADPVNLQALCPKLECDVPDDSIQQYPQGKPWLSKVTCRRCLAGLEVKHCDDQPYLERLRAERHTAQYQRMAFAAARRREGKQSLGEPVGRAAPGSAPPDRPHGDEILHAEHPTGSVTLPGYSELENIAGMARPAQRSEYNPTLGFNSMNASNTPLNPRGPKPGSSTRGGKQRSNSPRPGSPPQASASTSRGRGRGNAK